MDLNTQINLYILDNFAPSIECNNEVLQRYSDLKKILSDKTFKTGSYKRGTSCKPVNDLDVIYRTEATSDIEAQNEMAKVTTLLKVAYKGIARVEAQTHSIGIYFGKDEDFSIDVVPSYISLDDVDNEFGDPLFRVPEIAHKSIHNRRSYYESKGEIVWIKSDPKGYVAISKYAQEKNPSFRPAIVLLKKWRRGLKDYLGDEFQLKSFHLEQILIELSNQSSDSDCLELCSKFYTSLIPHYISSMPIFVDRADKNRYIDDYEITNNGFEVIDRHAQRGLAIIEMLKNESEEDKIKDLLEDLVNPAPKSVPATIKTHKPHKPHASC